VVVGHHLHSLWDSQGNCARTVDRVTCAVLGLGMYEIDRHVVPINVV
jgi:hypothetical protein